MWSWAKKKTLTPIKEALNSGVSRRKIAISIALGLTIGLIPFYGITTVLLAIIAIMLRLNVIAMQAAHYLIHPIQIILIVPFLKLGSLFVKNQKVSFSVKEYIAFFKTDFWGALQELWLVNLSAIIIWGILSIPLFFLFFKLIELSLKRYIPVRAE